jgi:hypothetical protein
MEGFILILAILLVVSIIQYFRSTRPRVWFATGVFSLVLIFLFSGELPPPERPAPVNSTATSTAASGASAEASVPAGPAIPESQAAFTDVIATARDAYDAAANDLAKGGERPKRGLALCSEQRSTEVKEWVGTVYRLSTNSEGRGVLSVELPGDIWLSTWNIALADAGSNTLIATESPLFATLSTLKEGQPVIVSGVLFEDQAGVDCFKEMSMLMDSTMSQPEFLFRFTGVRPAP